MYVSLIGTDSLDYNLEWPPSHDMFQQKIDEIFIDMPNVFYVVKDILIVEYDADGRDHYITLTQVMQIYH